MPGYDGCLRILTWNINGIRSLEDFQERLQQCEADIICIQETKVTRDMLAESVACIPGFTSYFSFCRVRAGYSGVATYCRLHTTPTQAEEGIGGGGDSIGGTEVLKQEFTGEELKSLDAEGRCVITRHMVDKDDKEQGLVIINLYCPRAGLDQPDYHQRVRLKLQFYKAVDLRANALRQQGDMVVVLGDINTSHREIDHCDPYEGFEDNPGRRFLTHFLQDQEILTDTETSTPEKKSTNGGDKTDDSCDEWQAVNVAVEEKQFIDTFRIFHPDRKHAFTCWDTSRNCRSTNYGTRIDYIFCSLNMSSIVQNCDIQPEVLGSDHCPVQADLSIKLLTASRPPAWCTKFFREFAGKQVKVSDFFVKGQKSNDMKRKCESDTEVTKKQKVESKKKITSFFVPQIPKENKDGKVFEKKENCNSLKWVEGVENVEKKVQNVEAKTAWGALFKPPAPAPVCTKHKEEAVKRRVVKKGPNTGKEFWCCRRGDGRADDPEARCDFFKWLK